MAISQETKLLISLGTGTGAAATLPNFESGGTVIQTVIIESASPQVGDVIAIHDIDDDHIIPPVTIGSTDPYYREILVNNKFNGVHVQTNTGGRATVWVTRRYR